MRVWLAVLGGLLVLLLVSVVVAEGRDNEGETVRPERWADDVCDVIGAWEGQLEVIGDEIDLSSVAVRRHDGGSGDEVEGTDLRARRRRPCGPGDQRHAPRGPDARREPGRRERGGGVEHPRRLGPVDGGPSPHRAERARGHAEHDGDRVRRPRRRGRVLENAAEAGREAFAAVAELDPELADAIEGERSCQELRSEEP